MSEKEKLGTREVIMTGRYWLKAGIDLRNNKKKGNINSTLY
jgi:hypothetical protein